MLGEGINEIETVINRRKEKIEAKEKPSLPFWFVAGGKVPFCGSRRGRIHARTFRTPPRPCARARAVPARRSIAEIDPLAPCLDHNNVSLK